MSQTWLASRPANGVSCRDSRRAPSLLTTACLSCAFSKWAGAWWCQTFTLAARDGETAKPKQEKLTTKHHKPRGVESMFKDPRGVRFGESASHSVRSADSFLFLATVKRTWS